MKRSFVGSLSISSSILSAVVFLSGSAAHAQDSQNSQNYLQFPSVEFPYERGNHGTDFFEMYKTAGVMTSLARAKLPHILDLPYGGDVKQRLDVYVPVKKPTHAPVFLFIHGGAFEEGDRAYYGYVAMPLAAHGIVTVVTSYRLHLRDAPKVVNYAGQEDDVKHAIIWIYRNIARYGGDPTRIYIGGHSSGGTLAGDLGVDRAWLSEAGIPQSVIRGVAQISGGFRDSYISGRGDADPRSEAPTAELRKLMSPIEHIGNPAPRFVLAAGEKEIAGSFVKWDSLEKLRSALASKGAQATIVVQPHADHAGAVLALGDEYSPETQAILKMISGVSFP